MNPDTAALKDLGKVLDDPEVGVNPESAKAIKQLFGYVLKHKPIDPQIESRWRQVGRLTPENKIVLHGKDGEGGLDLILMSLEYQGTIEWTSEAKKPRTPKILAKAYKAAGLSEADVDDMVNNA